MPSDESRIAGIWETIAAHAGDAVAEGPQRDQRRSLAAASWFVQSRDNLDGAARPGIAVCEVPIKPAFGFTGYLRNIDRKSIGAVEANAAGTLTEVEAKSAKYAAGLAAQGD